MKPVPEEVEQWRLERYREGWSDYAIAKACGLNAGAITSWRQRRELPPNRPCYRNCEKKVKKPWNN